MTTIVILAAGLGSRFGGNKQLVEFGNKKLTLMEYNLLHAAQAGFERVIFVIRPELSTILQQQVLPRLPKYLHHEIVLQTLDNIPDNCVATAGRTKPLGTAHALWCCHELLTESFAVINADDYYGEQTFKLLTQYKKMQPEKRHDDHLMVAYQLSNTLSNYGGVNRGLCKLAANHTLNSIEECENITKQGGSITGRLTNSKQNITLEDNSLISMNCWYFSPDIMPLLEAEVVELLTNKHQPNAECFLPEVVMKQISSQQKNVTVLTTNEQWFGLTYPQDTEAVEKKLLQL
jgi:choline kinase